MGRAVGSPPWRGPPTHKRVETAGQAGTGGDAPSGMAISPGPSDSATIDYSASPGGGPNQCGALVTPPQLVATRVPPAAFGPKHRFLGVAL